MCMATLIPAGVEIPYEGLENGAVMNDDGHGWAVASHHGLWVGKSMDFTEAIVGLDEAREAAGPGAISMFHSRFATHGTVNEFNVHPFRTGPNGNVAVAHNGILPAVWHPKKHDQRSDTRVLVDQTIPRYLNPSGIPSRRRAKELGNLIGAGNKLVILSAVDGVPKARVVNAHLGQHSDGCWFSNGGYRPVVYRTQYATRYARDYSHLWDRWSKDDDAIAAGVVGGSTESIGRNLEYLTCKYCEAKGFINVDTRICEICDTCDYCGFDSRWCGCWDDNPTTTSKELVPVESSDEIEEWTGTLAEAETLNPEFTVTNPTIIG